jgi:AraC family transcriptional regulator
MQRRKRQTTPVGRALWLVENRLAEEISLKGVAAEIGVTPYYLTRAFGTATGRSFMEYARGRRLTEAARSLLNGDSQLLQVALDYGYARHATFTRAFRKEFGVPPHAFRKSPPSYCLKLTEPLQMDKSKLIELPPPRLETREQFVIAGLRAHYSFEASEGIPDQWRRFAPQIGHVEGQLGPETFGVSCNFSGKGQFDYITGVRVRAAINNVPELSSISIAPARYVVFTHPSHVIDLHRTHYAIWNVWMPQSGHRISNAPNFELYHEDFNPVTGTGKIEIWMPVESQAG